MEKNKTAEDIIGVFCSEENKKLLEKFLEKFSDTKIKSINYSSKATVDGKEIASFIADTDAGKIPLNIEISTSKESNPCIKFIPEEMKKLISNVINADYEKEDTDDNLVVFAVKRDDVIDFCNAYETMKNFADKAMYIKKKYK